MASRDIYEFGAFRLDPNERRLTAGAKPAPLTPKVFDTLLVLVSNPGRVIEKEELLKTVWPDTFVEESNLAQNVSVLRKVLADGSGSGSYIETVPKRGYRFTASVQVVPAPAGQRAKWPVRTLLLAGVNIAVAFAAVYWLVYGSRRTANELNAVAVLPFLNLSSEPENEYFSDGLTEELITALSNIDGLRVPARTTVFQFKGKAVDIAEAGRQLRVDAIVEGSVRKEKGSVRVTVHLNKVADGYQLWSKTYDRELKDLLPVQEDICRDIAGALKVRLASDPSRPLVKRYTGDASAYELYLKGRYQANLRTLDGIQRSMEFFQQVVERDPGHALAYAGLADSYNLLAVYSVLPPREAFPRAREAARRALKADAGLPEAHAALAVVEGLYQWNHDAAEAEYKRALSLNADYAAGRQAYAEHLSRLGRHDEALREIRRALELEPASPVISSTMGLIFYFARDYQRAIEQCRKAQALDPGFPKAAFFLGYAFERKGLSGEAIAEFRKGIAAAGSYGHRYLAHALATAGRHNDARAALDQMRARAAQGEYVSPFDFALVHAGLNEREEAFFWLDAMYREHSHWLMYLKVDPRFDHLRADPRMSALIKNAGL